MLVPFAFVPCQYHVTPVGSDPAVNVLAPHTFEEIDGVLGVAGIWLTVTETEAAGLQQPALDLARR